MEAHLRNNLFSEQWLTRDQNLILQEWEKKLLVVQHLAAKLVCRCNNILYAHHQSHRHCTNPAIDEHHRRMRPGCPFALLLCNDAQPALTCAPHKYRASMVFEHTHVFPIALLPLQQLREYDQE